MAISIAFIISRMNWFRFVAPVIDRALGRGWSVECWLDVSDPMPHRPEDFPSIEKVPVFKNGKPNCVQVNGRCQILEWIEQHRVDVVIDLIPPGVIFKKKEGFRSRYVCFNASADWCSYVKNRKELQCVDMFALSTPFWFEQALSILRECSANWWSDSLQSELSKRARYVGWPQMDQLTKIDPNSVRKKWGIPDDIPVVVYFNWVDASWTGLHPAVFVVPSFKNKIGRVLMHLSEMRRAPEFICQPDLKQIIQAIRKFCDRNNALLIIKHRYRDRPTEWEIKCADLVIGDENFYPHTIFEVLSIASLAFGYFSYAVREAVVSHVPYVAMDAGGVVDIPIYSGNRSSILRRWSQPGGFFNYKGVVSIMSAKHLVEDLPKLELCRFTQNPDAAKAYSEKYLGIPGRSNSDLCLDEIESLLTEGGSFHA